MRADPCPVYMNGICQNGGTCYGQSSNSFTCMCPPSKLAAFPIHYFLPSQILSTNCTLIYMHSKSNGIHSTDYLGDYCEIRPCTLSGNNCEGHYTCINGQRDCLDGWKGPLCDVRDFDIAIIGHDGECPFPIERYCFYLGTCFQNACCCAPGYTGTYCEVPPVSMCAYYNYPCENGATCQDYYLPNTLMSYRCVCPPGEIQVIAFLH